MYSYSEFAPLTKEEIIKRVSQEEIYEIVTDYLPQADKYVCSPIRDDKNKGAYYEWVKGILYFKDFADPIRRIRDCFQFIMEEFNLNYNGALEYVNNYFQLGLGSAGDVKPVLYSIGNFSSRHKNTLNNDRSKKEEFEIRDIITKSRTFTDLDRVFWYERYGIRKQHLIEDNVFPTLWYKFYSSKKKQWLVIRPQDICYTLNEFDDGYKKIYRPFAPTSNSKWLTNCTENQVGFINKPLFSDKRLWITKAYKCCRVLHNQNLNSRWFQSETMFPKDEILIKLCNQFDDIVIWYDNDKTGIEGGKKLKNKILELIPNKKVKGIIYPKNNLGIKDPSDLRHKKGEKELQTFINKI